MNRPIITYTHGVLDYLTAPTLLTLPRLLKLGGKVTNLLTGAGLSVIGYSLMTRYELGLFKVLPMKGHLTMDMVSGVMLAAAPFMLLKEQERNTTTMAILMGFGAFEIAASLLTQTQPPLVEQAREGRLDELVTSAV